MAISTYASYVSNVAAPYQRQVDTKTSLATSVGRAFSLWTITPDPGVAPTTAVVPTRATAGSIGQFNSAGVQRLAQIAASSSSSGTIFVCDRLSHQGGLVGNVTTPQTTNLPTAALTRYTDGVGVMAAFEIYTAMGTTLRNVTMTYTNQAGDTGKISPLRSIGSSSYNATGRFMVVPLAAGDSGVRAVASVTIDVSTTAAGNFGVTLFKPLFAMPLFDVGGLQFLYDGLSMGQLPRIIDDACLWYVMHAQSTITGNLMTANRFIEE